jgi:hypothetical protein
MSTPSWLDKIGALMDDPRCCGTGACIINAAGDCWCGQKWDGSKMCYPNPNAMTPKDGAKTANEADGRFAGESDARSKNT